MIKLVKWIWWKAQQGLMEAVLDEVTSRKEWHLNMAQFEAVRRKAEGDPEDKKDPLSKAVRSMEAFERRKKPIEHLAAADALMLLERSLRNRLDHVNGVTRIAIKQDKPKEPEL